MRTYQYITVFSVVIGFLIPLDVKAQETAADLAQKLANPVASLISVPFRTILIMGSVSSMVPETP